MLQVANDNEISWAVVDDEGKIMGHVYAYTLEGAIREAKMWYPDFYDVG